MSDKDFQDYLMKLAKRKTIYENDTNACDASGGNYDDAYSLGCDDGETSLARQILTERFGIEVE